MKPPAPIVRAFEFRCPGKLGDGRPCRKLLLRGNPAGDFTLHCHRCGRVVRYRDVAPEELDGLASGIAGRSANR